MSAGKFAKSFYEANYGAGDQIHPIRVQEETLDFAIGAVVNTPAAVTATNPIRAQVGKGKREIGLGARMVNLEFPEAEDGTQDVPDGYTGDPLSIPVLTKALAQACVEGAEGTYLGVAVKVISLTSEDVN
jgi:hypothetical protein